MHGNAHLVGDVLKQRLGFDGLVVSDWNGIEQVPGCTKWHCPQAINAGIDLIMVPDDWKQFIPATVEDVKAGRIPMSRIDDAVSRIIRVKMQVRPVRRVAGNGPASRRVGDELPGRARARSRGGSQVARSSEERRRRPAAQAHGQDPGRRQGRGQPSDAGRRLVAHLAGRQYQDVRLSECRDFALRDAQDRSAQTASITAPTAPAWTSANYSGVVHGRGREALCGNEGRHHFSRRRSATPPAIPRT